jgi:murein DD-endopeptidase MepM/ murein hydrolase activator NlpD
MADDTPPGTPTHRPLPQVGIPLLRDDVERTRQQRNLLLGLGAAGVAVVLAITWLTAGDDAEVSAPVEGGPVPIEVGYTPPLDAPVTPDAGPPPAPVEVTHDEGGRVRTTHLFGTARGFGAALTAAGLSGAEAEAVVAALDGVLDFRRCQPDDELVVERAGDGTLDRFEYRASLTQVYEASRDEMGALHGREVEVPVQRERLARGGTVASSLGTALERAGLGRSLVGTFVDTFEGRMNFDTDTRSGDAFRVLIDSESIDGTFLRWGTVHAIEYRSARRGTLRAFWFARGGEDEGEFHDETGRAMHGGWLRTPLRFDHISSPFNPRRMHPVLRRLMPHNGIDFAAGTGTPVWAAADGEVTFVGERGPNGNLVSIRHEGGWETAYAHLSRFASGLRAGAHVEQRDVIGYVGSTGRSTGPHLHFGLRRGGRWVDPASQLNGPGRPLPASLMTRFRSVMSELGAELDAIAVELPATAPAAAEPAPEEPPDEPMGEEAFD